MAVSQEKYLEQAKALVLQCLEGVDVQVYLFGSRARNTAGRYSDIDIALLPRSKLPSGCLSKIKNILEESTIPYFVDVVDLSNTDETFRNQVLSKGILWKD